MCVCLLNVGVFTREDRHTDDMKNKQAGIAHEELKTDRKAWIFGGGVPYIYVYTRIAHVIWVKIKALPVAFHVCLARTLGGVSSKQRVYGLWFLIRGLQDLGVCGLPELRSCAV